MLARIINMRGVNLKAFDFDYDLTWAGFFLNGQGRVLGRYGGRDQAEADAHLSLAGLKHALRQALVAHANQGDLPPETPLLPVDLPEDYPAAARLKADDCIHCHQAYDFRRDKLRRDGQWRKDLMWVYPPPENVGLVLDTDQGNLVKRVLPKSPAARAGLQAGDVLRQLHGHSVVSYADAQYALEKSPAKGQIEIRWQRGERQRTARLRLAAGWRESDISWRGSMWNLSPTAAVYGTDLSEAAKAKIGLGPRRLAFYMGDFVPHPAAQAGIQAKDIILGLAGENQEMSMLQFNVFIRKNFEVGDQITYEVIRKGKRLTIPMKLAGKDWN